MSCRVLGYGTDKYPSPEISWLLVAAAGLPRIRVYDLRHTHATLLLSAGVPFHVASKRLGHAIAKMTLEVYAHVLSGDQEQAVERMEEYLSGVR